MSDARDYILKEIGIDICDLYPEIILDIAKEYVTFYNRYNRLPALDSFSKEERKLAKWALDESQKHQKPKLILP